MTPEQRAVLGDLIEVVMGNGRTDAKRDRGFLPRFIRDEWHTERCQIGMYVTPESRLTFGEPCSARCRRAREVVLAACDVLEAEVGRAELQPTLFEQEVAG